MKNKKLRNKAIGGAVVVTVATTSTLYTVNKIKDLKEENTKLQSQIELNENKQENNSKEFMFENSMNTIPLPREIDHMKTEIQPNYVESKVICACGNVIETNSTQKKETVLTKIKRFFKKIFSFIKNLFKKLFC